MPVLWTLPRGHRSVCDTGLSQLQGVTALWVPGAHHTRGAKPCQPRVEERRQTPVPNRSPGGDRFSKWPAVSGPRCLAVALVVCRVPTTKLYHWLSLCSAPFLGSIWSCRPTIAALCATLPWECPAPCRGTACPHPGLPSILQDKGLVVCVNVKQRNITHP